MRKKIIHYYSPLLFLLLCIEATAGGYENLKEQVAQDSLQARNSNKLTFSRFHLSYIIAGNNYTYWNHLTDALSDGGYFTEAGLDFLGGGNVYYEDIQIVFPVQHRFDAEYSLSKTVLVGVVYTDIGSANIYSVQIPTRQAESNTLVTDVIGNAFNAHIRYNLLPYPRESKTGLAISVSGGFTVNHFKESQRFQIAYRDTPSYELHSIVQTFSKNAWPISTTVNLRMELFFGRYFSIILADVNGGIGFVNPTINKTVVECGVLTERIPEHTAGASIFSFGMGLAMHY